MSNQVAIELSNRGVQELSQGNYNAAFQSLSKAVNIVMMKIQNHVHVNSTGSNNVFVFTWENCNESAAKMNTPPTVARSIPFLSLRALRISTNIASEDNNEVNRLCPCGYAWAIWFNLALCSSVIGARLGEQGKPFLEMAYDLYEKIQHRVENEPIRQRHSKHWTMISMIVSNNQACIFYDLCMHDDTIQCLQKLASALNSCDETVIGVEDRGEFCLNLQIMGDQTIAAAA